MSGNRNDFCRRVGGVLTVSSEGKEGLKGLKWEGGWLDRARHVDRFVNGVGYLAALDARACSLMSGCECLIPG